MNFFFDIVPIVVEEELICEYDLSNLIIIGEIKEKTDLDIIETYVQNFLSWSVLVLVFRWSHLII